MGQILKRVENKYISRNQFYFILIFIILWLLYCWWLSEEYQFNFGEYTIIFRLLFCIIHILTIWIFFQYIINFIFRLYRLGKIFFNHLLMTIITFLLLTFVLNFKEYIRKAVAIVD